MHDIIDAPGELTSPENEYITPVIMRQMAMYEYFLRHVRGRKALEVGFGEGYGTDFLAREATEITGIDVSQDLVEYARNKYARKNVWFMRSEHTAFPFHDEAFDVVVSAHVLEHVKDYNLFLQEVKRVLRTDGTAVIATLNRKALAGAASLCCHREYSADELREALGNVFPKVEVTALFGSQKYMALTAAERGLADRLVALDFLRLRRFAPRFMMEPFCKKASGTSGGRPAAPAGPGSEITVDDFWVGRDVPDKGLDLIGICGK